MSPSPILSGCSLGLLALVAALAGCDPAPNDVREWTPAEHDQPAGAQNAPPPRASGSARASNDEDLVELAWEKSCVNCHGPRGRGDGPQGPMLRAPDLTRAEWQDRVSDAEMAETIRKGRNKMPSFALPPQVITGLVKKIRAGRAK
jgi:mono/diheme cytochrome c family protein